MTTSATDAPSEKADAASTKASRKDHEAQTVALYLRGATAEEIATAVGLPSGRGALRAAERAVAQSIRTPSEISRAVDVARANVAITALWPRVEAGQPEAALALASLLAVRAQLLGLTEGPLASSADDATVATAKPTRTRRPAAKPADADQLPIQA